MGYGLGGGRGRGRRGWRGGQWTPPQVSIPPPTGLRVAAPVDTNAGLQSIISQVFARAPFIAFIDINNGQVVGVRVVDNPGAQAPGGAGRYVAQFLLNSGVKIVLAPSLGPNALQALSMSGIQVYNVSPGLTLIDALKNIGLITG